MKLQIAIDLNGTKELLLLVEKVKDVVDIVEVGTPIIMLEGMKPITELRKKFPEKTILADTKIVDGAALETKYAIDAGADIITVLAVAEDQTIIDCIETAHEYGKKVLVDLISVRDVEKRAREVDKMGADYISVHTAADVQSSTKNPLNDLIKIKKVVKNAAVSCAGGINEETIDQIIDLDPDVVIIGSSITSKNNQKKAASNFYKLIKEN